MTFAAPMWLIPGGVVIAGLIAALVIFARRRRQALAQAGLPLASGRARFAGLWLVIAAVAAFAVAVAGPAGSVPVPHASGTIIVAIDVSGSMGADDAEPSRLEAAKQAASAFVATQPSSVDIGVVSFQSDALQTSIVSGDHTLAAAAIARVTCSGGTSLANAILGSLTAITGRDVTLPEEGEEAPDLGYWGSASIVLFSDGEDFGEELQAASELAQAAGVHIYTVGFGTVQGATVNVDGYTLRTALDEETLRAIAEITGGAYHPPGDETGLEQVARQISTRFTVKNQELPLGWVCCGLGALLLLAGAATTLWRTGRLL
ncbi:MAG: VWA domain-containing protein [Propionibacteriaceae bacterium]|jgi:Ca-activated chloride channel family protein|nr:VWA domain-containing protein [Propionibacteriaceae bacterium]